jgi:hypothetical protein
MRQQTRATAKVNPWPFFLFTGILTAFYPYGNDGFAAGYFPALQRSLQ